MRRLSESIGVAFAGAGAGLNADSRPEDAPISDYAELEAKILTNDKDDFERLIDGLRDRGILKEAERVKMLYSSYFDRPDFRLANNGLGLRIRYQNAPEDEEPSVPDISSKTLGEDFGDGTRRIEIESKLAEGRFDLDPYLLMREHGGDADARTHIENLLESMNHNPQALREIFYIDCTRTNFKICLYVVPDATASANDASSFKIKTKDQLNGDADKAKRAVFEFSLDHSRFYAPSENGAVYLGSDYEIEFEVMTGEGCKYDPNPMASDPDLSEAEAEAAQQHIFGMIYNILDPVHFSINCDSKQERGMTLRSNYEADKQCDIGLLDRPTRRGNDDVITPNNRKKPRYPHTAHGNTRDNVPRPDAS